MQLNQPFNPRVSLYKNIQARLTIDGKSYEDVADELHTTTATIRTIIGNKFQRGKNKSTPLDVKVYDYFAKHIPGFKEYCEKNGISVAADS